MTNSYRHLEILRGLVIRFDKESGDVVIGKMLPELGSLIVTLSAELDSAQRKVVRLTWALLWLTLLLAFVEACQLVVTFNPPQARIPQQVPQSSEAGKYEEVEKNRRKPLM